MSNVASFARFVRKLVNLCRPSYISLARGDPLLR